MERHLLIDTDISISNLIYFMKTMLSEVFHREVKVRLRSGLLPFSWSRGFELSDISCLICGGDGCPTCKQSGWLELCPCGMIHPNVLTAGGARPGEIHRLCLWPGTDPAGDDEIRHQGYPHAQQRQPQGAVAVHSALTQGRRKNHVDFHELDPGFCRSQQIDLDQLIQRFTLSTAEVEVFAQELDIEKVVAGKILSVDKHPNSKKLHLLKVDTGSGVVDCVCGAPNVRREYFVPFACAGGRVCAGEIGKATVAGYPSEGMCCSESELGISADHSGLMELPEDTVPGTDIKKLYAIEDTVFEVDNKSLTNRPDLWGHYGIAREFAALAG